MTRRDPGRFVAYLRVSTDGQGRSGLGLEAQRQAVAAHVAQAGGEVVAEFREVESGKRADRPQLAAALASCRTRRAVLVIAKLDRLARNARFLLSVVADSNDAGQRFRLKPDADSNPSRTAIPIDLGQGRRRRGYGVRRRPRRQAATPWRPVFAATLPSAPGGGRCGRAGPARRPRWSDHRSPRANARPAPGW